MQLDWATAEVDAGGGADDFYTIKPGKNVMRVVSSPVTFKSHWCDTPDGKKKRFIAPTSGDPLAARGFKASKRFGFIVLVDETGTGKTPLADRAVKILEVGPLIFNEIVKFAKNEDYGDPAGYDFTITKSGSGQNGTNYDVVPRVPTGQEKMSPEVDKKVAAKDFNLQEIFKSSAIEDIQAFLNGSEAGKVATPKQKDQLDSIGNVDTMLDDDLFADS